MDPADLSPGIAALSRWIDDGNQYRDPEAATWARLAKITEEAGEVVAAHIGATGQNPRKGVTHSTADVEAERDGGDKADLLAAVTDEEPKG